MIKNPLSICAVAEMLLKLCNVVVNMKVMQDDDVCNIKKFSGAETYSYWSGISLNGTW